MDDLKYLTLKELYQLQRDVGMEIAKRIEEMELKNRKECG